MSYTRFRLMELQARIATCVSSALWGGKQSKIIYALLSTFLLVSSRQLSPLRLQQGAVVILASEDNRYYKPVARGPGFKQSCSFPLNAEAGHGAQADAKHFPAAKSV